MSANAGNITAYFSHLVSRLGADREVHCVAVAHMVPNTLFFAPALNALMTLAVLLAKPKSIGRPEFKSLSERYYTPSLSRDWAADSKQVVGMLNDRCLTKKKLIFIDIGGYFSQSINDICSTFDGTILGVLEGTENGAIRYEKQQKEGHRPFTVPIITVARSPLKLPEDYLVGSSIVFSIEAVLRDQAEILQTRSAIVIGYGRVGSSVANILRARGINSVVFDTDAAKLAEAAARGFQAVARLDDGLPSASLVVCATGGKALELRGFGMLQSGCVVASVTSADDEFDLGCLAQGYNRTQSGPNLVKYEENRPGGRHFFLIADGNAANFIHGAVIGPAIQLIEGEKLMAIRELILGKFSPTIGGLCELGEEKRREVAEIWIEHFL
jgi:adenosylhomocysteinase